MTAVCMSSPSSTSAGTMDRRNSMVSYKQVGSVRTLPLQPYSPKSGRGASAALLSSDIATATMKPTSTDSVG